MSRTPMIEIVTSVGAFQALSFGTGPCVLLLHGFPDSPYGLAPLAEELATKGFRVVVPWLRGYAPSTCRGPFHSDQLGIDAVALADALAAHALVGHDWGAVAAHRACALAPTRFACAVTLSVPHPIAFLSYLALHPAQLLRSWYMFCFQLPCLPEWLLSRSDFALVDRLWRAWSPGFSPPPRVLSEAKRCLANNAAAPVEYYRAMTRPLGAAIARVRATAREPIVTPTLHLHGADDGCIAPAASIGQERFFAGPFRSRVIPGAGHFLGLEEPEAVAGHIARWLSDERFAPQESGTSPQHRLGR